MTGDLENPKNVGVSSNTGCKALQRQRQAGKDVAGGPRWGGKWITQGARERGLKAIKRIAWG